MMKKFLLLLCLNNMVNIVAEPRNIIPRCSQCENKKKKKEAEIQAATLGLVVSAVNGAFAVAANPGDKNTQLGAGHAVALGVIGLVAAALKTMPFDVYDAFGNRISPEKLAQSIGACLSTHALDEGAGDLCVKLISHFE